MYPEQVKPEENQVVKVKLTSGGGRIHLPLSVKTTDFNHYSVYVPYDVDGLHYHGEFSRLLQAINYKNSLKPF